jgi:hypothetical protein
MISLREVVASLYGAWRLARLDRGAVGYFDASPEGFWRSFFAAVLVAPSDFAIQILFNRGPLPDDLLHYMLVLLVTYVFSWLIWPLASIYLVRALGRSSALLLYLTAHNWAQVVATLFQLAVAILARGLLPAPMAPLALLLSVLVVLGYEWFVASAALHIDRLAAAAVVAAYFVVSVLVSAIGANLSTT